MLIFQTKFSRLMIFSITGIKMVDSDPDLVLSCPICMEKYSDTRYPIAPYCGHSICKECGDKRRSNQCVSCTEHCFYVATNKTSPWPSNNWNKNFALLDLVNLYATNLKRVEDEREQYKIKCQNSFVPNDIDFKTCSSCNTMEKRERLQICETCAEKKNVDWKGMEEEDILHAIVCGHCFLKQHSGHEFIDYVPWKLQELLSSTVTNGESTVSSMDEICAYESEKGKEQLEKWNEEMNSFTSLQLNSYRDGTMIADSLKLESDVVTRFSEDCIPPLRKYRKAVTDSISRLQLLKKKASEGNVDVENRKDEVTRLLETLPQLDLHKEEYEETIQKLEQKLEDEKLKEWRELEVKVVHCRRFPTIMWNGWPVSPTRTDRLHFSVSHPMILVAVEVFGALQSTRTIGHVKISSAGSGDVFDVEYPLWKRSAIPSTIITSSKPAKLFPNTEYLLEMNSNGESKVFCGEDGIEKHEVSPGKTVTFRTFDGENNSTTEGFGQFPGFFFLVDEL